MISKRVLRSLGAIALLSTSLSGQALPISEYSLILEEDYDHHSAVWGRTFIGGDMVTGGGEFGTRLDQSTTLPSLTVVGDITGNSFNIMAGDLNYGGSLQPRVSINGGGSAVKVDQASLAGQGASMINELKAASAQYSGATENGQLDKNGNQLNFNYTGAGSTAYFNVNARDVFTQNSLLQLNKGNAETVVINVSTEDLAQQGQATAFDFLAPNGINFGNGFDSNNASNILWNFYDATNLSLQDLKVKGSVLAMGANILSIGTIDGSIAARSFIQDSQVHNYTFTPPSEVPLPASVIFMLMGVASLFTAKWYRRRQAA